jgi:hypothetical protein
MAEQRNGAPVLHVRFDGRSRDIPLRDLDLGPGAGNEAVKRAVARFLEVPESRLRDYVVDRHETGNLTVQGRRTKPGRKGHIRGNFRKGP